MKNLSTAQKFFKILLSLLLIGAGVSHLTWAKEDFVAQVPLWLPLDYELVVIVSGIIEIALGSALLFLPKHSAGIGWTIAAFFVLIFPGNVSQYMNQRDALGLNSDQLRFVRMFFQPVFVVWSIWASGAWDTFLRKHTDWKNEQEAKKSKKNNHNNSNAIKSA